MSTYRIRYATDKPNYRGQIRLRTTTRTELIYCVYLAMVQDEAIELATANPKGWISFEPCRMNLDLSFLGFWESELYRLSFGLKRAALTLEVPSIDDAAIAAIAGPD